MSVTETVVYESNIPKRYWHDGHYVEMPAGWEFVPSGDPGLTRRLKAFAKEYWVVKRKFGRKEFGVGLIVPGGLAAEIGAQLKFEREQPEYQKKLEAGRQRREKAQARYQKDFEAAVLAFLDFHPRWSELARRFAAVVTGFTTPVGSGTVARTETIPIEERARAAVIAWMRHHTTDYDRRYIPRVAGKRREVRRDIAHDSLLLLEGYRQGADAKADCPLQKALNKGTEKDQTPKPTRESFWL